MWPRTRAKRNSKRRAGKSRAGSIVRTSVPTSLRAARHGKSAMANKPFLLRMYTSLLGLGGPLVAWPLLRYRRRQGKEMATRIGERRGLSSRHRPEGLVVWVHAASVGEFVSVLPLIHNLVDPRFLVLT